MKKYAITLLFLFFDLSFINGHTLAKNKLNNVTDVYEVNEEKSAISITHPKDSRPTLREIVYFHIIEKPYDQDDIQDIQDDIKMPDLDKIRSFTNGHGYQYLNEADSSNDSNSDNESDESKQIDEVNEDNDTPDSYEYDEVTTQADLTSKSQPDDVSKSDIEYVNADEVKTRDDINDQNKKLDDLNNEPIADDLDVRFGDEDTDNVEIEKRSALTQEEEKIRRKREIDYTNLPEAPSLPDFKWDILPDYIKAIILEEPNTETKHAAENLEEEIEKKIKRLKKAVNHPPQKKGDHGQKREARTFGMSLAGDSGVIWNDVSAAHVTYHVGEPESVISTTSNPTDAPNTIRTTTKEVPDEPTNELATEGNRFKDSEESDDLQNQKEDSEELKDIEASFDEIDKILEELITESTSKPDITKNKDESKVTESPIDSTTEMTTTESTTEKSNNKANCNYESSTHNPDPSRDSSENNIPDEGNLDEKKKPNDRKDVNSKHKDEDSKQKQFVMELMKNKYFWQWLQDSSAAYLEIMMKKVVVLIKTEVDKQIKVHKNAINNCNLNNNITSQNVTENPNKSSNNTDSEISTTQNPIVNNTLDKPIESNNATDEVTDNITQNPNLNNTLDKSKVDESKINVNESEVRKNNKHDKNTDKPVKIEAQNVYGNSVGNGKVTNIFIFNISKESDLQNIKPLTNGTNGMFVFGLDDKNPNQENDKNEKDNDQSEINKESHENDNRASTIMPETVVTENIEQTTQKETSDNINNDIEETSTTEKAIEVATKDPTEDLYEKEAETEIENKPTDDSDTTKSETNKNEEGNNGDEIEETSENVTDKATTDDAVTDKIDDKNTSENSTNKDEINGTDNEITTEEGKNSVENEVAIN